MALKDPAKSLQLTTNLIPILISAGLTAACHPLLGLSRLHLSLLLASFPDPLTQSHLDDTIKAAHRVCQGLSLALKPGHPVLAIAYTELGRLLSVDEPNPSHISGANPASQAFPPSGPARLKLAYDTMVVAREMLLTGFGKVNDGGLVGKDVRECLVSLEKEIGVWKEGLRNAINDGVMRK